MTVPDAVVAYDQASATPRNGSGRNRVCFTSKSLPVLGTTWTSEVDASAHPNAGLALLYATSAPQSGFFLHGGELLVRLPAQGARFRFVRSAPTGGGVAHFSLPLPHDLALVGLESSVQAFVLGGRIEFCNAIDLVLGL